jgi:hypothetical protein
MDDSPNPAPSRFWRFFLSEALLLTFAFGGFMFLLTAVMKVTVPAAFATAATASGIAGLAFLYLVARTQLQSTPRALALVACLLLSYGVSFRFAPKNSMAGQSPMIRNFHPPDFIRAHTAKQGVPDICVGGGSGGGSGQENAQREFDCELIATQAQSNELLDALRDHIRQQIEAKGATICGRGSGSSGYSTQFSFDYRQPFLRGYFHIFSRKLEENKQLWYGYWYETNTANW